jgi:hypothetical protein
MNNEKQHPRTWRATNSRWKALKVWCAKNGMSIQDFIDKAVEIEAKSQGLRLP